MRTLHLDSGREMRGGQWQVLRLVEGLHDAALLAPEGSPLYEAARARGIGVDDLQQCRIVGMSRRVDLVHAHDARAHTLAALLSRAPLVVSRRVAFPIGSRLKYSRPRHFIAVSEFVKRVLMEGGVAEQKISVVYDGVPVPAWTADGSDLIAPATGDPQKGAALAVEAARLAGVQLRFSQDLETDLRSAGRLLYLTYSEGLGSAALLAMAAGVPVIASNIGGLPEAIGDGGILVDNDARSVAEALRRDVSGLGERARRRVIEHFSIDQMVEQTRKVYERVLA